MIKPFWTAARTVFWLTILVVTVFVIIPLASFVLTGAFITLVIYISIKDYDEWKAGRSSRED